MEFLLKLAAFVLFLKLVSVLFSAVFVIIKVILSIFFKILPFALGFLAFQWQRRRQNGLPQEETDGQRPEHSQQATSFSDFVLATASTALNRAIACYQRLRYPTDRNHMPQIRLSRCSCQNSRSFSGGQEDSDGLEQLQLREAIRRSLHEQHAYRPQNHHRSPSQVSMQANGDDFDSFDQSRECPYPRPDYELRNMPHPNNYGGQFYTGDWSSIASAPPVIYHRHSSNQSELYGVD